MNRAIVLFDPSKKKPKSATLSKGKKLHQNSDTS